MSTTKVIDSQCYVLARSARRDTAFNFERMHDALLQRTRGTGGMFDTPAIDVVRELCALAAHYSDNPRPGLASTAELAKALRKHWRTMVVA